MRDNLARKLAWPLQEAATVVGVSGRGLRVRSSSGEFEVRRAASCLLEPALGDEVLVAHHERGSRASRPRGISRSPPRRARSR